MALADIYIPVTEANRKEKLKGKKKRRKSARGKVRKDKRVLEENRERENRDKLSGYGPKGVTPCFAVALT